MKIRTYDTDRYDFAAEMRRMLAVDDLSTLQSDAAPLAGASLYKNMERASLYNRLLETAIGDEGAGFRGLYRAFVTNEIAPLFAEPILFQARPTGRIVFANVEGEPRFHRDRDYGHDPNEVNFIVPLTQSFGSAAVWVESGAGRADHRPVDMQYGDYLQFDGASLSHGAVANRTGRSRVSFDFRIVPVSKATSRHRLSDTPPSIPDPHVYSACE